MARIQMPKLVGLKGVRPIVLSTAYDYSQARLIDGAVDAILVGDSLGMVVAGLGSTLEVTLDQIIYHCQMVARGAETSLVIGDLPFLSYQVNEEEALRSAGRLIQEGKVQAVKLEGGSECLGQIKKIVSVGIPVVGHLGMEPQKVLRYGGYGKQAKGADQAATLKAEALAVQDAGVSMLVLENIEHALAAEISQTLEIPTIGIGAGAATDGQVQVFHDLMGLDPNFSPRHAVPYRKLGEEIRAAIEEYAAAVKEGKFHSP